MGKMLLLTMLVAAALPARAGAAQESQASARTYLVQQLPGMKFLANVINDHGKYFDLSYNGPTGLPVGDIGASIETNDPCWISFKFHRGAFAMNDYDVVEATGDTNFDFRNITEVFVDSGRVYLKNPHWGPYVSVLYPANPADAPRMMGAIKVMIAACKGVPV